MRATMALVLLFCCCLTAAQADDATSAAPSCGKEIPYKYVGNSFSLKFHRPSCPFARQMWTQRMQLFRYRQEAIDSGYRPCNYCLPAVWTRVHAVVRQPSDNSSHRNGSDL